MRKLAVICLVVLSLAATARNSFSATVPDVRLDHDAVEMQRALYPDHYARYDSRADLQWADSHDSLLENFWTSHADTILELLSELSGLAWTERSFDLYILRYFPSLGSPDPLCIPVGGIRDGDLIEAAPEGGIMKLNLIYQLGRRLLSQADNGSATQGVAFHPLMRPGAFRRDNLALLLAVAVAERVIGRDETRNAWQSSFWRNHFPGMEIFETHLADTWTLTTEKTLSSWVLAETPNSELINATRPPQRPGRSESRPQDFVEGLPLKGNLGMAVSIDENGLLRVDKLDPYRAAYAGGLREGDLIRTVNKHRVQNHRQLAERILETLYKGGATIQYVRAGNVKTAVLRPLTAAAADDDRFYPDDSDSAGATSEP